MELGRVDARCRNSAKQMVASPGRARLPRRGAFSASFREVWAQHPGGTTAHFSKTFVLGSWPLRSSEHGFTRYASGEKNALASDSSGRRRMPGRPRIRNEARGSATVTG